MSSKLKAEDISTKEFNVYFPFEAKEISCPTCGHLPCTCAEDSGKIIQIRGYANFVGDINSTTDIFVDHCDDAMDPAGFDLSIWGKNPQILWNHDRSYTIGKGIFAEKCKEGLVVTAEIHERAMDPQDFYKIEHGLVTMFSVGFRTLQHHWKEINGRDVNFITKALLHEVSVVSLPMNSESQFTRIKSFEDGSFSAHDFSTTPTPIGKNKEDGDTTMKLKLRDMLSVDKVKELEDLGLSGELDTLKEVDTKSYIDGLVAKAVAEQVKAAVAIATEELKAAQVPSTKSDDTTETEKTQEELEAEQKSIADALELKQVADAATAESFKALQASLDTLKTFA